MYEYLLSLVTTDYMSCLQIADPTATFQWIGSSSSMLICHFRVPRIAIWGACEGAGTSAYIASLD